MPQDADANGAYHIGLKGLMLLGRIKNNQEGKNSIWLSKMKSILSSCRIGITNSFKNILPCQFSDYYLFNNLQGIILVIVIYTRVIDYMENYI